MLTHDQQQQLLALARSSIEHGLSGEDFEPPADILHTFTKPVACFVTLTLNQRLRGCIGNLVPDSPLAIAVARNAHNAAFQDPRFAALTSEEHEQVVIEISLLSEPDMMIIKDEADLIAQLQPQRDGLILQAGTRRATFLPSAWQQLPEPAEFIQQLKHKAGLPDDGWQKDYRAYRYTVESFSEKNSKSL